MVEMTDWNTLTRPYPLWANVRALADDGVFVTQGMPGHISGREQRDDQLFLEIIWANDTKTTLPCEAIERIGGYGNQCEQEEGAA